jgi:hypothetical protein
MLIRHPGVRSSACHAIHLHPIWSTCGWSVLQHTIIINACCYCFGFDFDFGFVDEHARATLGASVSIESCIPTTIQCLPTVCRTAIDLSASGRLLSGVLSDLLPTTRSGCKPVCLDAIAVVCCTPTECTKPIHTRTVLECSGHNLQQ